MMAIYRITFLEHECCVEQQQLAISHAEYIVVWVAVCN